MARKKYRIKRSYGLQVSGAGFRINLNTNISDFQAVSSRNQKPETELSLHP
jgi:hypothetical protein